MKSRTHRLILTITTNRACSARVALREARDNIHGLHYCAVYQDGEPDTFRVRSIKGAPRMPRRR